MMSRCNDCSDRCRTCNGSGEVAVDFESVETDCNQPDMKQIDVLRQYRSWISNIKAPLSSTSEGHRQRNHYHYHVYHGFIPGSPGSFIRLNSLEGKIAFEQE